VIVAIVSSLWHISLMNLMAAEGEMGEMRDDTEAEKKDTEKPNEIVKKKRLRRIRMVTLRCRGHDVA